MVPALKLAAETNWKGPQRLRFHLHGEIPLSTVEHENSGF